jgi:hypothetical protein
MSAAVSKILAATLAQRELPMRLAFSRSNTRWDEISVSRSDVSAVAPGTSAQECAESVRRLRKIRPRVWRADDRSSGAFREWRRGRDVVIVHFARSSFGSSFV